MDLLGIGQVNCFRTHNELTIGLLGKCPLAPSDTVLNVSNGHCLSVIQAGEGAEMWNGDCDALFQKVLRSRMKARVCCQQSLS